MSDILEQLAVCIERGKVNAASPYPPDMRGQDGADELTKQALDTGVKASDILRKGLMVGMSSVGHKFSENKVFVPDLLMAAKAMTAAMVHLKPYFESGEAQHKGIFVIGTVQGDLHDIGKNLVSMMLEGAGFEVIDLGSDVDAEKFVEAVKTNQAHIVGMSALLTTTMTNMPVVIQALKNAGLRDGVKVMIGGAPVTKAYADQIGADGYAPDASQAAKMAISYVS